MKLVLSVLRYLPALGGSTRVVQLLAEGVAARGNDVTVVSQEEPNCPPEETINGVKVVRVGMRHVAGIRLPKGYIRKLRSMDADVFHLHGNRIWCADYYLPFAGRFKWPQVITPHNFYHYYMKDRTSRWLYYNQYFAHRIHTFEEYIALTNAERDLVASWGYPSYRLNVIPNGIDLSEFNSLPDRTIRSTWGLGTPYVALYVGGFYDNKRVDRLIRAVAATKGQWGLVTIGSDIPGHPYDQAHCAELARELGAHVRFLGSVPRDIVLQSYAAADAYLQGSAFEGFGICLLEAMATGLPFITFDTGAAKELAATGAGFLVQSEKAMTTLLPTLIEDRDAMRMNALSAVRDYSAERMVNAHLTLYESMGYR